MSAPDEADDRPLIEWCGKKHIDMTREELMDFVETLDWHIGNLTPKELPPRLN